jgi:CRISPR-associated endonuclease/helicase Cas3
MSKSLDLIYKYWGKASQNTYHLLLYHCLDVAAVGKVWLEKSPAFVQRTSKASGLSNKAFIEWFIFFLALHDIGKFDVRFQGKVIDVLKALQPDAKIIPAICKKYCHGESGWAWGIKEQQEYFGGKSEAFENWLRLVTAHHGEVPQESTIKSPAFTNSHISQRDNAARISFVKTMKELLAPNQLLETLPQETSALLAGFCSVCDWVGSNSEYFPPQPNYNECQTLLDNCLVYYESQFCNAEKALNDFGILPTVATAGGMNALFPDKTPRGVQTLIQNLPPEQSLTIIEAPTGSGKTESALAYASMLLSNGIADTVTFALPTQATANAMFPRMEEVASTMFHREANMVLAHGRSIFNESFLDVKNRNKTPEDEDCFVQCSNWLANSKKRSFLGQIGVCTIDQVLLSVLPVKHYFVRSFWYRQKCTYRG